MDANKENYIVINGITYKPIIVKEYTCNGCEFEHCGACKTLCDLFEEKGQKIIMKKLKIEG